ncbi:hypothetical protein [Nocardia sp. NPDC005366]|uniref:hypothetical protein n=1 Tax=Nocardia sp. NPDC005366 TaxID=3156878 RepID=UPI0033AB7452
MRRSSGVIAAVVVGVTALVVPNAGAGPLSPLPRTPGNCSPLGANIGYVANFGDDNVLKIDLNTNTVIQTIGGFSNPWGVELNADGSLLYVNSVVSPGDPNRNDIAVMDTCTNAILEKIPTVGPGYLQVSSDHKWIYAPNLLADGLQLIDAATGAVVRNYPTPPLTQAGVSFDQKTLWAAAMPNLVYTLDMATGLPDGPSIDPEGILPLQFTMSQDGSKLAVADFADRVAIIDTRPGSSTYRQVTATYNTGSGSQPGISAFSPDGRYLWVGGYSGQVSVIDLQNREFTCWNLRANAFGTTVSEDGKKVYLTSTPNGTVVPGTGFGALALEAFKVFHPGGVVHIYDAETIYRTMTFGTTPNCSATTQSNAPEFGTIAAGNVPIAVATLNSAGHIP